MIIPALFALLLVGCDQSNPVEQNYLSDALYGEESMYKATITTEAELSVMKGEGSAHDSVRHGRMLGHLKTYLELTDAQFDSAKVYAGTMFETLKNIRTQVHDSVITRAEAKVLVVEARAEFVASIKLILTADQIVKFERWVTEFWNKHPRRHGHGGRGGHGGPGGRP